VWLGTYATLLKMILSHPNHLTSGYSTISGTLAVLVSRDGRRRSYGWIKIDISCLLRGTPRLKHTNWRTTFSDYPRTRSTLALFYRRLTIILRRNRGLFIWVLVIRALSKNGFSASSFPSNFESGSCIVTYSRGKMQKQLKNLLLMIWSLETSHTTQKMSTKRWGWNILAIEILRTSRETFYHRVCMSRQISD
jgi:hypothetical protein